ncbi:MAG TPA: type II/IV secretion system ATPase subunit [archaeon]|nr:type II/IV secretion system ATPase subunit [archaeon]
MPKFSVKRPEAPIIERPEDMSTTNITYPLIDPFASVSVKWDDEKKEVLYKVNEPQITQEDRDIIKKISGALMEVIDIDITAIKDGSKIIDYIEDKVRGIIKDYRMYVTPEQYMRIMYYIYRNFVGLNEIEAIMQDGNIEDISCDGVNIQIYVIHRKFGSLKTNVMFTDPKTLGDFVIKLAQRCARYVSYAEPILDATLPDGSRVAATLATDVAVRGGTFTIRKFSEHPFSPTELIKMGTASSEMFAYFWYLMEHKSSGIVVGGTGTGKTSFLNSIAMFIPPEAKIVSIEDTRELRLSHNHWISGISRVGFGTAAASGEKYGEVTLFDLLRETFRQNPDYVIVGETRGEETYVMFQGMASGHSSLSTFHAGSVETLVKRLTTAPINLSPTLLESLSFVAVMTHAKEKGASSRRVKDIVEIVSVDPRTDEMATNIVFQWNPTVDKFDKVNESVMARRISSNIGAAYEDVIKEIENRKKVLDWMVYKEMIGYVDVTRFINEYYKEPARILTQIGEIPAQTVKSKKEEVVVVAEKPKRERPKRISILDLLGFRMVREKDLKQPDISEKNQNTESPVSQNVNEVQENEENKESLSGLLGSRKSRDVK